MIRWEQAFVSEYAVTGSDAGKGSLLAALAEGAFLIGLELNRFAISYFFCLFVNMFHIFSVLAQHLVLMSS